MYRILHGLVITSLGLLQAVALPVTVRDSAVAAVSSVDSIVQLNNTQLHRILFQVGIAGAGEGINMAIDAYDSREWCAVDAESWCPNAINQTMAAGAYYAVQSLPIDFDDCDSACLLSSMCTVNVNATMWALSWADRTFNQSGLRPTEHGRCAVRAALWLLSEKDQCVFDIVQLNEAVNNQSAINTTISHVHRHGNHLLPTLVAPSSVLAPFFGLAVCKNDPLLCGNALDYLKRFFRAARSFLRRGNVLQQTIDNGYRPYQYGQPLDPIPEEPEDEGGVADNTPPSEPSTAGSDDSSTLEDYLDRGNDNGPVPEEFDTDSSSYDSYHSSRPSEDYPYFEPEHPPTWESSDDGETDYGDSPGPLDDEGHSAPGGDDYVPPGPPADDGWWEWPFEPLPEGPHFPSFPPLGPPLGPPDGPLPPSPLPHGPPAPPGPPPTPQAPPGVPPPSPPNIPAPPPPIIDPLTPPNVPPPPPSPHVPPPFPPNVPPPPLPNVAPPELPAENAPTPVFRGTRYNVQTDQTVEEYLVPLTLSPEEIAEIRRQAGISGSNKLPYRSLDAEGRKAKTVWRDPTKLTQLPDEALRVGDQYVHASNRQPYGPQPPPAPAPVRPAPAPTVAPAPMFAPTPSFLEPLHSFLHPQATPNPTTPELERVVYHKQADYEWCVRAHKAPGKYFVKESAESALRECGHSPIGHDMTPGVYKMVEKGGIWHRDERYAERPYGSEPATTMITVTQVISQPTPTPVQPV